MLDIEKRQSRRISIEASSKNSPTILDISSGGLRLKFPLDKKVTIGQPLDFNFILSEALPVIRTSIKIIWTSEFHKENFILAGAQFTNIHQYHKSALLYYGCQKKNHKHNLSKNFTFYFFKLLNKNLLRSAISDIHHIQLPEKLKKQLQPYQNLTIRNDFFYNCCYKAMKETTLPCVDKNLRDEAIDVKFHGFLFSVILDDLLDQGKEYALLDAILKIPFSEQEPDLTRLTPSAKKLFYNLYSLWNSFYNRLKKAPQFKSFENIFQFDYQQFIQSIRYASLLHHMPQMNNSYEAQMVHPHSIHVFIHSTIDLMYSTNFNLSDLAPLRNLTLIAQYMSHITNWIASWERELFIEDFTSGVYAYAVEQNIITFEQLLDKNLKQDVIQKIKNSAYKQHFFLLLDVCREEIEKCHSNIKNINMAQYIKGIENLFLMQITYNL